MSLSQTLIIGVDRCRVKYNASRSSLDAAMSVIPLNSKNDRVSRTKIYSIESHYNEISDGSWDEDSFLNQKACFLGLSFSEF
jgi:hypothetical protein